MKIEFAKSEQSTLGLEWEIALVDAETGELAARASDVFANISAAHPDIMDDGEHPHIKGEMLQNTVELVTGVCHTVAPPLPHTSLSAASVRALPSTEKSAKTR